MDVLATNSTGSSDAAPLREIRTALLADRRLRGRRFCEAYSEAVDALLSALFADAVGDRSGIALLAVGGYGRRELCPGSDLDLLLLHDGARGIAAIADRLWYPLWDSGVPIDHSVRTLRETTAVVRRDLKSALGMLDGRLIAGDPALASAAVEDGRRAWTPERLGELRASLVERWEHHGELAFLLEPDVKLSRGGLRDHQASHAVALAIPEARAILDEAALSDAGERLLTVRVALHAVTERRSDRLVLEDQDAVARRLGAADADELMPDVAASARRVSWAGDAVWRIAERARSRTEPNRIVEPGIIVRGGELALSRDADPSRDASLALRAATASARTGVPLARDTLTRLQEHAAAPGEPWPHDVRDAFLELLACGSGAVQQLETLDHIGVLARYVHEWGAVRSRPQRNAYHRFTVDRHLFEAAAEAAAWTRSVHRPDLLLVAAFLHDIGKGFPGDHTEAGQSLVRDIAARMGFDGGDVDALVSLVRDHLLLAETATRRDLSDPATMASVASRVESIERLELLTALTRADSLATGPAAWSPWKASLVDELVIKTRAFLAGERREWRPPAPTQEQRALMTAREVRVIPDGSRLTVVAPDRRGLLSIVAAVLALNRLDVRTATGISEDGMAVETFELDARRRMPDWERVRSHLLAALQDPGSLADGLSRLRKERRTPGPPQAAKLADPQVIVDAGATERATVLEVRAHDAPGLLARVTRVIADHDCDITFVRALTLGHEVVDTFYVVDVSSREKIDDPTRLQAIERAILDRLDAEVRQ